MASDLKIGFLGAGKMATALAKGFIRASLVSPANIFASDPLEAARSSFTKESGVKTTALNTDIPKFANVLILAVKPEQVSAVLTAIRTDFTEHHLLLSIAAGVPLAKLEAGL